MSGRIWVLAGRSRMIPVTLKSSVLSTFMICPIGLFAGRSTWPPSILRDHDRKGLGQRGFRVAGDKRDVKQVEQGGFRPDDFFLIEVSCSPTLKSHVEPVPRIRTNCSIVGIVLASAPAPSSRAIPPSGWSARRFRYRRRSGRSDPHQDGNGRS